MSTITCPVCGQPVDSQAPVCPNCQTPIANNIITCPQCGTVYLKNLYQIGNDFIIICQNWATDSSSNTFSSQR